MSEPSNPGQWPTMPGAVRPATQAAPDPLRVEHRKTLAPEPLPGQAQQVEQPAAAVPALADTTPAANAPVDGGATPPAAQLPVSEAGAEQTIPCPHCGVEVATWESFCEACGGELTPTTAAPMAGQTGTESPIEATVATSPAAKQPDLEIVAPQSHACSQCGGIVGPDGYCTACGSKALSPRDHYVETPSAWVSGCCDKGIRHHRNEDAMALWCPDATLPGPQARAVLVVCDGVSSSEDSDVAALAAARRARDLLAAAQPQGVGTPDSKDAAYAAAFVDAVEKANEAVIAHTAPDSTNAASCTFVAAIVDGTRIHVANVGDSRAYWLGDDPAASQMLSLDDSIAQARIAMGVSREEAENGYQAHAITKWLGRDAEDTTPRTMALDVPGPGWLMVCSDGLWNYCTEPADLAQLVRDELSRTQSQTVVALSEHLVAWANEQGGRDNITVTLARFGDWPQVLAPAAATEELPTSQPTAAAPVETTPVAEEAAPAPGLATPSTEPVVETPPAEAVSPDVVAAAETAPAADAPEARAPQADAGSTAVPRPEANPASVPPPADTLAGAPATPKEGS